MDELILILIWCYTFDCIPNDLNHAIYMFCMVSDSHYDDVFLLLSLVNVHRILVLNVFEMGECIGLFDGVWDSLHRRKGGSTGICTGRNTKYSADRKSVV